MIVMKIRKTVLHDREVNVYVYENKKEAYFVTAIPDIEWSKAFTYEDAGEAFLQNLANSLAHCVEREEAEELAQRVYQWTREM